METWWASMELFEKVMWCIAIPSSIVFIIQMIMTFVGADSSSDFDSVDGGDISDGGMPFHFFTFRNLINFLLGFSWTGISFYNTIHNRFLLVLLSAFVGLVLVAIVLLLFVWLSRMVQSGNIYIDQAVGKTATVYIPISGKRARAGKVQVSVNGAVREYDAITDSDDLRTGELVVIKEVVEGNMLLVAKP